MPGRISKNLRSGFLHEELGVLLVRQLAVVAPVPRPDDIGNDAIGTLLKPPAGILQYADSSFYVQFKAQSVDEVLYNYNPKTGEPEERGELDWLMGLQLPFFLGHVNDENSSIRLYTLQNAYAELISNGAAQSLRLRFGPVPDPLEVIAEQAAEENLAANGDVAASDDEDDHDLHPTVYLGIPIIEWTMTSHHTAGFYGSAYAVLKPWMDLEHSNSFTRGMKILQKASWATDVPPTTPDGHLVITSSVTGLGDAARIIRFMTPAIRCFLLDRIIRGTNAQVATLDTLIEMCRILAVDPCSEGLRATIGESGAIARQALADGLLQ
jgi:hypothetical protein